MSYNPQATSILTYDGTNSPTSNQPQTPIIVQPMGQQTPSLVPGAGFATPPVYAMGMSPPQVPGVPIGLELLIPLNRILIKQQVEVLEVFSGLETRNQYDVITPNGQRIYKATETSGCCALCCGGGKVRPFKIEIIDGFGRVALLLDRPCSFCLFCSNLNFGCCLCGQLGGDMVVNLPDGTRLGKVVHICNCCTFFCTPKYELRDETGNTILRIRGPCCSDFWGTCCCSADFPISTTDGEEIGFIRKSFAGFVQEYMTDADNFGVDFPIDLNVKWKALVFAAVFLIDFMYFEGRSR